MALAVCNGRSSTKYCCKFRKGELPEEAETGKARTPGEDGEKNPPKGSKGKGRWEPGASGPTASPFGPSWSAVPWVGNWPQSTKLSGPQRKVEGSAEVHKISPPLCSMSAFSSPEQYPNRGSTGAAEVEVSELLLSGVTGYAGDRWIGVRPGDREAGRSTGGGAGAVVK